MQIAYRSGQRLLAIVGDLLTVDKVDAGAMDIHPQDVTLDELVAPTCSRSARRASARGCASW